MGWGDMQWWERRLHGFRQYLNRGGNYSIYSESSLEDFGSSISLVSRLFRMFRFVIGVRLLRVDIV